MCTLVVSEFVTPDRGNGAVNLTPRPLSSMRIGA